MGYVMLWLLVLATALLLLATIASLTARSGKKIVGRFLPRLAFILVALVFVMATVITGLAYFTYLVSPLWPFYFWLTLTVAFIIGSYWAMHRGLSKSHPGPPAASWPRGALAGSLGIVFCLCLITFMQLAQDRRVELANLRTNSVGLALRLWPEHLPDDQNAAIFYHQASLALTGQPFLNDPNQQFQSQKDRPEWLNADYQLRPEFDTAGNSINKILDDHRRVIDLIEKGISCPGIYTDIETDYLVNTPIPFYTSLRDLTLLKRLEAINKAQKGDMEGALADLAMIDQISDQLLEVPILVSVMLSVLISSAGYDGLEYILAHYAENTTGALPLYSNGLTPAKPCLRRAFELEAAIWQDGLFHIVREGAQSVGIDWGLGNWSDIYTVFFLSGDLETMEWIHDTYMKTMIQPYPEAMKTYREATRQFEETPQGLLARNFALSFYSAYYERVEMMEARRGLAALALAAFNYQNNHGRYPVTLDELVPNYIDTVPADPFDLKPLKMKALADGLDLYSIGIDSQSKLTSQTKGPIHFYLGANAYQEFRVKPFQEDQAKKKGANKK